MGFLTPNAAGERDVLATYCLQQLAQLRTTVHGLSDEQAHAVPSASALNLTGLLLHCAQVAAWWSAAAATAPGRPEVPAWAGPEMSLGDAIADERPLPEVLAYFDRCVAHTREQMAATQDLSAPVPVPEAPWFPDELTHWEARWCLVHVATEVARHAGHADIIRESIDGMGSYALNDAVDAEAGQAERT